MRLRERIWYGNKHTQQHMFELRQRVRFENGSCKHLRSSSGRCFLSILRPWRNKSLRWRSACAENLLKNKQNGVEVTILIVIALFARSDFTIGGSHFRLCFGRKTWRERPRAASSRLSGSCSCNRNVRDSSISTNQSIQASAVVTWHTFRLVIGVAHLHAVSVQRCRFGDLKTRYLVIQWRVERRYKNIKTRDVIKTSIYIYIFITVELLQRG